MKKLLFACLFLTCLSFSAAAQVPVKWPVQRDWQSNDGINDRTAITYTAGKSRLVSVTYGTGIIGPDIVSRQSLNGSGAATFRLVFPSGTNVAVGLDASATAVGAGSWDYYVSSTGNVNQGGAFVLDASPIVTGTTEFSFEITGTSVALKKNGSTIHTFAAAASLPLYLHVSSFDTGAGISDAQFTGTLSSEAAAPSAPTCTATAGYKRNHITVTYPSGANGVAIYRSTTSNGQDFTTPIVTEWRLPVFEDTALTNGTTYYYKCKATIDGLSESAASTQTSAIPATGTLPTISENVAFIIDAPAVRPIGDTPDSYWFDRANEEQGIYEGMTGPILYDTETVSGTVSVTNGSKTVTGSGTAFLTQYRNDGYIKITDSGATERLYRIYYVNSNTSITLWDAYAGATESGRTHRPWWLALQDGGYFAGYLHYYDLSLTLYHLYLRTGNPYVLQLFRENADAWYRWCANQVLTVGDGVTSPRQAALAGLALRALDGQTSYWTLINNFVTEQYAVWIQTRITFGYFDNVRDASYVLQYTAIVGKMHPTEAVRTDRTTKALNGVLNLFEWQMNKYSSVGRGHVPRLDYIDASPTVRVYHYHQPFIDAIMGEMYIMVYKLTGNATVKAGFLAWVGQLYSNFDTRMTTGGFRHRRMPFGLFNRYQEANPMPAPNVGPYSDPMDTLAQGIPDPSVAAPITIDVPSLPEGRFLNALPIGVFGYAYYLTGNTTYLTQADDLVEATYGNQSGVFDTPTGQALSEVRKNGKNLNEAMRRAPNYFAYKYEITPLSSGSGNAIRITGGARAKGGVRF